MLEQILTYERSLFLALHGHHTPFWDEFFWLHSGFIVWLPVAAFLLFAVAYRQPVREVLLVILAVALLILVCDQFTSGFAKPFFHRFRPTHHPDFENLILTVHDYRGGLYGFISGHACNSFGVAMFFTLLFRNRLFAWSAMAWATLNAYSRIYLGVHFISDIIAGTVCGLLFGYGIYYAYRWLRGRWLGKEAVQPPQQNRFPARIRQTCYILYATYVFLFIYAAVKA
ncbi:MAG: phosphatase PAP2 family protein [Prevotellaceae bacterium]|jgi:undecaprenyl-diphosphatase|nr:phosphatase PAP2 family protein [Prevotellaceae bacterium]